MLTLEHVRIAYPNCPPVIEDLSLELRQGELLALIGPNGCGKTTLLRGISGTLPLQSGLIRFGVRSIPKMTPRERAKIISVVPQFTELPKGFSVLDCVSHGRAPYTDWTGGLSSEDRAAIDESLRITELSDLQNEEADRLSGGQQQRIVLARVFAQQTPIILLDEPNTFLDLRYQIRLLKLLKAQCREKGTSVLMILHDLNSAFYFADRIALLDAGKLLRCGKPSDLCDTELLSSTFRTPLRILPDGKEHFFILPY